jgi:hypothetical protein
MAVQLNPSSPPAQGANVQASPNAQPAPAGVAGAPSTIVSQADDSCCICGWITKICEWIISLFSSSAPAAPVFTLEQRIQKGKEFIDQALRMPPYNRDRTVLVCALSYNGHYEVPFGRLALEADHFKDACYQRLEDLLRRNEQVANGTLTVFAYFCEKQPNGTHFNALNRSSTIDFTRDVDFSSQGEVEGFNVTMDEIRAHLRQICGPAFVECVNSAQLISNL